MSIFSLFCQLRLKSLKLFWQTITIKLASVGFSMHKTTGLLKKTTFIDPSYVNITRM